MPESYAVRLETVHDNEVAIRQILIQLTESQAEVSELIESGGVVIETDDKDEAEALADQLRDADAEVEIERRETKRDETREYIVEGVVVDIGSIDEKTPLKTLDIPGPTQSGERQPVKLTTGTDRTKRPDQILARVRDISEGLAERDLAIATVRRIPGVTVHVFDRDIRGEQRLGQAVTDEDGRYTINYTPGQFQESAELGGPDLVFQVFTAMGEEIDVTPHRGEIPGINLDERGQSVIFDAKPLQTVHLVID